MNKDMKKYYAQRAFEYEGIYRRSERQTDLALLEQRVSKAFDGLDVLEIACGTGYWTRFIARSAKSIFAVDCNAEGIVLASEKDYGTNCRVNFIRCDAYELNDIGTDFSGAFCGFWWSHLPQDRIATFLETLHFRLRPDARVLMIDNRFVHGSSTPISRRDANGNSYQRRTLADGSIHEVLKNFPTETELQVAVKKFGHRIRVTNHEFYWVLEYLSR